MQLRHHKNENIEYCRSGLLIWCPLIPKRSVSRNTNEVRSEELHDRFNSSDGRVVRASASAAVKCRLEFESESGQINNFKIGIPSFPTWRSALKGQCGEQAGKFICCTVGIGT